ncbi:MAG: FecR domain-containing protein [Deltaproteobacteria bacterium]|nr:FecR domain-containing protein [Deltaproteobacteria bacterium]
MNALVVLVALQWITGVEATVASFSGTVSVAPPGGDLRAAQKGEVLKESSRVKTGAQSEVTLVLSDGSTLKLREKSEMQVAVVKTEQQKPAMVLFFGRLWSKIATKVGGNQFDVVTPSCVAGVRGTEFETAAGEDGSTRVTVNEGNVAVDNEKKQVAVGAGQQADGSTSGVDAPKSKSDTDWNKWNAEKRGNLQKNGEAIARETKEKIDARRAEAQALFEKQKALKEEYPNATDARKAAIKEEVTKNARRLAELGVRATGQFGAFEHWGELADDPEFGAKFTGSGYVRSELKRLRRVKAEFDKMIAEGTDMSVRSLEKMMDDMGGGKKTIKDKKGSSKDDLFKE